jgi:hypothetical protein
MDAIELRRDVAFAESGFALPASGFARKIVAISQVVTVAPGRKRSVDFLKDPSVSS